MPEVAVGSLCVVAPGGGAEGSSNVNSNIWKTAWGGAGEAAGYEVKFTATAGQDEWIVSASELEYLGMRVFSSMHHGEQSMVVTRRGTGFALRRSPAGFLYIDGSAEVAGVMDIPPSDNARPLSLLLDTGAAVSVAGRNWREALGKIEARGHSVEESAARSSRAKAPASCPSSSAPLTSACGRQAWR